MILLRKSLGLNGKSPSSVSVNSLVDPHSLRYSEIVSQQTLLETEPSFDEAAVIDAEVVTTHASTSQDDLLTDAYKQWLERDLELLTSAWEKLQGAPDHQDTIQAFFRISHNLKSSAALYGKPTITRLCTSLCRLLKQSSPAETLALINLHVDACNAASRYPSGAPEIVDAVCNALELQVTRNVA